MFSSRCSNITCYFTFLKRTSCRDNDYPALLVEPGQFYSTCSTIIISPFSSPAYITNSFHLSLHSGREYFIPLACIATLSRLPDRHIHIFTLLTTIYSTRPTLTILDLLNLPLQLFILLIAIDSYPRSLAMNHNLLYHRICLDITPSYRATTIYSPDRDYFEMDVSDRGETIERFPLHARNIRGTHEESIITGRHLYHADTFRATIHYPINGGRLIVEASFGIISRWQIRKRRNESRQGCQGWTIWPRATTESGRMIYSALPQRKLFL